MGTVFSVMYLLSRYSVCEAYVVRRSGKARSSEESFSGSGGFECSKERCGETRNEQHACHCSEDCMAKGDCCTNYRSLCKGDVPWLQEECEEIKNHECPAGFVRPPVIMLSVDGFRASYMKRGSMVIPNIEKLNLDNSSETRSKGCGIPLERRVLTMLQWLHLPDAERPYVYAMHSEQLDSYGHKLGPHSTELDNALKDIDKVIGQLMNGLKQMKLHRCINIILVGDHGMEEAHCDRTEFLSSYMSNTEDIILIPGSLGRIRARNPNNSKYDAKVIVANLTCKKPDQHFKPYLKQHLPKRLHYANNHRIEEVHLMVERKWHIARKFYESKRNHGKCGFAGDHGYDNKINSMQPAPNNGTHGSLNQLLRAPVYIPSMPEEVSKPNPTGPVTALNDDLGCNCEDKLRSKSRGQRAMKVTLVRGYNLESLWLCLLQNKVEELNQRLRHVIDDNKNLPYGRPAAMFRTKYYILHHSDYISGYSEALFMPLWTSYTVSKQVDFTPLTEALSNCAQPDIRVSSAYSQSCSSYRADKQISYSFLYPPQLSSSQEARYEAVLITNTVPMYPAFKRVWSYFQKSLVRRYASERNGVNVVVGPIFDYDYNGLRDSAETIKQYVSGSVQIPSHYYIVVTSCLDYIQTVDSCTGPLSVFSFILPHRSDNDETCNSSEDETKWVEELIKTHTARIRDVELLTGLDFYRRTSRTYEEILSLKTYLHTYESEI
ncbi:Ectonucleotide pyrophosphatase/phosphodiesterase family member 2 [Labeo rohita]|uniref:Ectonucleotide pyrophosphatase/phosphodiesterase family member 2 n=1 Tax=Labeo rohita TaxID=84645 RepID=A0ABQ8LY73_LABRO|nr:Ectonucleotide pyrophosphatase/phosphodiesterase family member 2 [Labeo rohita]